ncbi:MAG: carbohydrate binding domain-containing protein [Planctomycetota bacterium]|nr:carbohydrate binding domain-containing protein [Planctomycetota bacterium]
MRTLWLGLVCVAVMLVGSAVRAEDEPRQARIDIDGTENGIDVQEVSQSEGGSTNNAEWLNDKKDQRRVYGFEASNTEWKKAEFTFKTNKDGTVRMCVMGPWFDQGGGKIKTIWMLYDDISVDGATLKNGDFEGGMDGWSTYGEDNPAKVVTEPVHGGKNAVKVWHNSPVQQDITVKANQPVKVTFWFKAVE